MGSVEWRLVNELADHPYRLLVTATPEGGETYAEVAHETIFRRWGSVTWTGSPSIPRCMIGESGVIISAGAIR